MFADHRACREAHEGKGEKINKLKQTTTVKRGQQTGKEHRKRETEDVWEVNEKSERRKICKNRERTPESWSRWQVVEVAAV